MTTVEFQQGLTTWLSEGVHRVMVTAAMSEPGIVIQSEQDDIIVIPADMVPYVLEAVARIVAPAPVPHVGVPTTPGLYVNADPDKGAYESAVYRLSPDRHWYQSIIATRVEPSAIGRYRLVALIPETERDL